VTHPFHPWVGREFVFVAVRQTWGQDRVFFVDASGTQHSLARAWTDLRDDDPFVTVAAGRSPFRVADLVALGDLVDGLRPAGPSRSAVT
jgi:Family of unknown function (DUF5372)